MIENFKGKRHILTKSDSVKGGKSKTSKKVLYSKINPVKSGKHAKHVKYCDTCKIPLCPKFEEGSDCSVYSVKFVQLMMYYHNFSSTSEFDNYIFEFLCEMSEIKESNSIGLMTIVLHKLIEMKEIRSRC